MGLGGNLYKTVLTLHIFSAIAGFGTVFFGGVFGQQAAKRKGREGLAISESFEMVANKIATPLIYLVLVFGILLVFMSKGAWSFKMAWVAISLITFIVALGISHGLHRPNLAKMLELSRELAEMGPPPSAGGADANGEGGPPAAGPPPQAIELAARGKKAAIYGTTLNLLMVVVLVLMVFKPGVAGYHM